METAFISEIHILLLLLYGYNIEKTHTYFNNYSKLCMYEYTYIETGTFQAWTLKAQHYFMIFKNIS